VRDQEGRLVRGREVDPKAEARVLVRAEQQQEDGLQPEDYGRRVLGVAYSIQLFTTWCERPSGDPSTGVSLRARGVRRVTKLKALRMRLIPWLLFDLHLLSPAVSMVYNERTGQRGTCLCEGTEKDLQ
jgi:hypothetical protein